MRWWFFAFMITSCANGPREEPLDLSEPNRELERTTANLQNYVDQLDSAIGEVTSSFSFIAEIESQALEPPFPLDAFKHSLVSCLNVFDVTAPEPQLAEIARRYGVVCAVPALEVLDRSLENGSADQELATLALQNVDRVRQNRAIAQKLLRDLPDQLARTNAFVGARKSELRRTREQIKRKKADYNQADYNSTMDDLAAYEVEITKLEDRVFEIEAKRSGWNTQLGDKVDALYKSLTILGERDG